MLLEFFNDWFDKSTIQLILRVLILLGIGMPILFAVRSWVRKMVSEKYTPHYGMLMAKVIFYIGFVVLFVTVLHEFGFSLGPLLGTAGIIGIAIGFASQTSVSNIISGFFLIAEKPFEVGDVINIDGDVGAVLSIDTLSVKVRMFDNRLMRIPNETMLRSKMFNITRFPIRRTEFRVSVAYKEDLGKVRKILFDLADKNQYALQEPSPMLIFDSFNNSSIDFNFNVWSVREEFLMLRNSLYPEIKKRFDEEGIEIPFPHLSLYTGSATKPFPVQNQNTDPKIGEIPERKQGSSDEAPAEGD